MTRTPHYQDDLVTLYHGDCLDVLRELPDCSVDAVCTDPPYGLEFMGKDWDAPWKQADALAAGRMARESTGAVIRDPATERGGFQDGNGGNPYSRSRIEYGRGGAASLGFQTWCEQWACECLRVLKPGGHLLAFGGTRMWHRLAAGIEDAGFEIRDNMAWLYGSGFPKSMDVTDAMTRYLAGERPEQAGPNPDLYQITMALRAARDAAGWTNKQIDALFGTNGMAGHWTSQATQPACPSPRQWEILKTELAPHLGDDLDDLVDRLGSTERPEDWGTGDPGDGDRFLGTLESGGTLGGGGAWGTALKPAFEPIVVARKPIAGTVAANIHVHGTGGLNIEACRVGDEARVNQPGSTNPRVAMSDGWRDDAEPREVAGRWPTNVLLDEHQAAELDRQAPDAGAGGPASGPTLTGKTASTVAYGARNGVDKASAFYGDRGGASRFFPTFRYQAKAPGHERPNVDGVQHPTVKPLDLMRWLVRLVTPPGAIVLEPFGGSGTTAEACVLENRRCITIEREATYLPLIVSRLEKPAQQGLFDLGGLE